MTSDERDDPDFFKKLKRYKTAYSPFYHQYFGH